MKKNHLQKIGATIFLLVFLLGISNQNANAWRLFGTQRSEGFTVAYLDGTVCYTETTYFFGIAVSSKQDCGACC